ncbi:MAG: GntR family transcriptional regulator [Oceanospirillaceae bacterium]|nr:GntR family transcriptional regulator [Oceanospirillaceae bacterium]
MPFRFLQNAKIDRSKALSGQVYEILLDAIVDQNLTPGMAIIKEEVAKALGVSRTPVSEAIAKLTEDRLVEVFPQRGTYVTKLHISDVKESAFIRQALEVAIARQVAEHHSAEMLLLLTRNVRYQKASVEDKDYPSFYQLDEEFHQLLCEFTGFSRLKRVIEGAYAQLARVRKMQLSAPGRPEDTYLEHKAILDAIKNSDGEGAALAMTQHVSKVVALIDIMFSEQPELFADK